jgi:hypothetical protein
MERLMTLRNLLALSAAAVLTVVNVSAFQARPVDLTGTWTGTFTSTTSTGEPDEDPAHLQLTQKGTELTGTGGPTPARQMPIEHGKVTTVKDVTTVTFQIKEGDAPINFDLKLVEGRIKGKAIATMPDGSKREAVLDVGRAK